MFKEIDPNAFVCLFFRRYHIKVIGRSRIREKQTDDFWVRGQFTRLVSRPRDYLRDSKFGMYQITFTVPKFIAFLNPNLDPTTGIT